MENFVADAHDFSTCFTRAASDHGAALFMFYQNIFGQLLAHLESAYSLIWGAREIWGKGGGETLALL